MGDGKAGGKRGGMSLSLGCLLGVGVRKGMLQGREGLCVCPKPPLRASGAEGNEDLSVGRGVGRKMGWQDCSPHHRGCLWLHPGNVTRVQESSHTYRHFLVRVWGLVHLSCLSFPTVRGISI